MFILQEIQVISLHFDSVIENNLRCFHVGKQTNIPYLYAKSVLERFS